MSIEVAAEILGCITIFDSVREDLIERKESLREFF